MSEVMLMKKQTFRTALLINHNMKLFLLINQSEGLIDHIHTPPR